MKPSWADGPRCSVPTGRALLLFVLLCALGPGGLVACAGRTIQPGEPIAESASEEFLEAWSASRVEGFASDDGARATALEHAEAALALQPDWAAPARFLDEWRHRPALTLPRSYARHLVAMESGDATAAYLAGRLGGDEGSERLHRATQLDPANGWGWHGQAWVAYLRNDLDEALSAGSRAAGLARDPHELALFSWALARYLRSAEQTADAHGVLVAALGREGPLALRAMERTYIEAELVTIELLAEDEALVRRGIARGLDLVGRPGLSQVERVSVATRLATANGNLVARSEIAQRLLHAAASLEASAGEASAGETGEAERVRTLADRILSYPSRDRWDGPTAEDRESLARGEIGVTRAMLVDAFESGDITRITATFGAWLGALPGAIRSAGEDSLPFHAGLQRLSAAVFDDRSDARIAAALLDVGWFQEALGFGRACRSRSPEVARATEERAVQGRATLDALLQLARRIDAREAYLRAGASGSDGSRVADDDRLTSLRELREEIVRTFERTGFGPLEEGGAAPMIKYGPLGGIVHPGVTFSAEDEAQGRGTEGDAVPGIAALFRSMNRFALVGSGAGQGGPDATILRVVYVEEREGTHLGRPFRGTVFWCEGADVPGRYGRLGAGISGAALHEGYYLDLEQIARERDRWVALGERFVDTGARAAALATTPARVGAGRRTEIGPALAAGDRMRLVVLEARAGRGADGATAIDPYIPIDVLTHVVGTHEEGHLCDRAGWYPLSFRRVMRLISFAGAHGFSGQRIAEALEERAQLVAIGACDDPRVPMVDLLDAAEDGGGAAVTPHSAAYRRLLVDLVERLEQEYLAGDWDGKGLDPDVRWIDQFHRLDPEDIRALAIREARARGMTGNATFESGVRSPSE